MQRQHHDQVRTSVLLPQGFSEHASFNVRSREHKEVKEFQSPHNVTDWIADHSEHTDKLLEQARGNATPAPGRDSGNHSEGSGLKADLPLACFEPEGRSMEESSTPEGAMEELPLVSILMPVHNAALFLEEMLASLLAQTYGGPMELVVFNDGPSTDASVAILERHRTALERRQIALKIEHATPGAGLRGCGYGRNVAALLSQGAFLCFADADDVMFPKRIELQVQLARQNPRLLVGANYVRLPPDATPRYTAWANGLSQGQLYTQQLLENTIITPTWFCSRTLFDSVGPFDEAGPGTPDDLLFFYRHLALGGLLAKVEEPLVVYRFHEGSVTGSRGVPKERIWAVRLAHLESQLLAHPPWSRGFTIWNAGKEGKRLYRSLSPANQLKVAAFCDVDARKIAHGHYFHVDSGRSVPVLPWQQAVPPLLLCVKRGLGNQEFDSNVASLGLEEGVDYVFFS